MNDKHETDARVTSDVGASRKRVRRGLYARGMLMVLAPLGAPGCDVGDEPNRPLDGSAEAARPLDDVVISILPVDHGGSDAGHLDAIAIAPIDVNRPEIIAIAPVDASSRDDHPVIAIAPFDT